jgi:hypothetical protein
MNRRHAILAAFWVPILGAIAWSYPHLVAWFRPWAPAGWAWAAHGAALMLDALILASLFARSCLPHDEAPAAVDHALWVGVGLSIYVNLRYGLDQRALPPWVAGLAGAADLLIGSAIAPALAMLGHRALDAVLRALPTTRARTERKPVQATPPAPVAARTPAGASAGLAAKWWALVAEHGEGKTQAQLAALAGVSRQAIGQWKQAAGAKN